MRGPCEDSVRIGDASPFSSKSRRHALRPHGAALKYTWLTEILANKLCWFAKWKTGSPSTLPALVLTSIWQAGVVWTAVPPVRKQAIGLA